MADGLKCWRCGHSLAELSLPLSRRDECPACLIELHVCRMCTQFDPGVTRACREDDAEEVREKERANFCDYFKPSQSAFDSAIANAAEAARKQLDGLFSDADETGKDGQGGGPQAADELFK